MLGSEERAILDFERGWWLLPGPKDQMIEFSLGLPARTYYEMLRNLVGVPEAMEYDPLTVRRVLMMIDQPATGEVAV